MALDYETKERLDRIDVHLTNLKTTSDLRSDDIRMIKTALIGDEISQETGLIHRVKHIGEKVEKLEEKDHKNTVYISQLKFVVALIITIIVGFMFNIILKK
jgi:hypothetical protein